MTIILSY